MFCFSISFLVNANAVSKSTSMTNNAVGNFASKRVLDNPTNYYVNRELSIQLAKEGRWLEAQIILQKLTNEYQDDGDTWFLLGHSYLQTKSWQKAISALTKAVKLGAALHGIEPMSPPSNDIMMEIAKAHSKLGNKNQAYEWINKALNARWDGRISLNSDSGFSDIIHSIEFQKLSGTYIEVGLDRNEEWLRDLDFLVSEIKRLHVDPFHSVSEEEFILQKEKITHKIPTLTDKQMTFELMTLVGMLGNGHNIIVPANANRGALHQLPMKFYLFTDGLYVVSAKPEYSQWIGSRVLKFGRTVSEDALKLTSQVNARDNEMQSEWLGPYLLSLPTVLKELKIIENAEKVVLTLQNNQGKKMEVSLKGAPYKFTEMPKLPVNSVEDIPLYLSNINQSYWSILLAEHQSLYVQFNLVANKKEQSLKEFGLEIQQKSTLNEVKHLILDLRHNNGGDGSLLPAILRALIHFETTHPNGKLFVLMGRKTFSAAHILLTDISRFTNAIFVGEPSGTRPNHMGESGWFKLPYSGLSGVISSQFHQVSAAEDHRIWISPHVPVRLSSTDYFSGKDPAMNAIFNIIKKVEL
jgi:tetratricopeptide (TPR) repeat protein